MALQLDIVTPEKKIFSDTVDSVYLPGVDGEMGILPDHAGLVTALAAGELRYTQKGVETVLAIGAGFAEVDQTRAVVLTDSALGEEEIDEEAVEQAIRRAEESLKGMDHSMNAEEVAYLQGIISRSVAALHLKRKYRP